MMLDGSVFHSLAILLLYSIQTLSSTNHQVYTSFVHPPETFFSVVPLFDFLYYLFKPGFWHWIFFPYCSLLIKQTYIFTYIFSWLKQMRIAIRFVFRILRQIMTTRMGLEKWWLSAKKTGAGRRNPPNITCTVGGKAAGCDFLEISTLQLDKIFQIWNLPVWSVKNPAYGSRASC